MSTQTELPLAAETPAPTGMDEHGDWLTRWPGVTVKVDKARHDTPLAGPLDVDPGPGGSAFAHRLAYGFTVRLGDYRRVHVMSAHAGGEIRSYELAENGGLLLAYPCYTGLWPEMDAEVARVVAQLCCRRTAPKDLP